MNLIRYSAMVFALTGMCGLFAAPASAQQRAGTGGRALDANQRVGSGRVNSSEGQVDYRVRNDVVTGNVGGGQALQIPQPYPTPGEFQGRLGSNDLFRFREQSLPSAPNRLDATQQSVNLGGHAAVYRSFNDVGSQHGGINVYRPSPRRTAPAGGVYGVNDLQQSSMISDEQMQKQAREIGGLMEQNPGRGLEVTASPLLGVREQQTPDIDLDSPAPSRNALQQARLQAQQTQQAQQAQQAQESQQNAGEGQSQQNPPGENNPQNQNNQNTQQNQDQNQLSDESQRLNGGRADARLGGRRYQPTLAQQAGTLNQPGAGLNAGQVGGTGPTAAIGQQLQGRRVGGGPLRQGANVDAQVAEARMNLIGRNLMNQAARQAHKDKNSPYAKLLTAVQNGGNNGGANNPSNAGGGGPMPPGTEFPNQPGQTHPNDLGSQAGAVGRSPNVNLPLPSGRQMRQAEQQRSQALRRFQSGAANQAGASSQGARGQQPGAGSGAAPGGAGDAASQGGANQQQGSSRDNPSLSELMQRLNYDMAPLPTLAGKARTPINQIMKQAEAKLSSGKYFDAERLYRQVLRRRQDQPLARVGLVHAQLGAGLIRSAALNLRSLFDKHPEVIAARYSDKLLPDAKRLKWVQSELSKAMASSRGGGAPALMMAYLGYQVHSPQLVRYGLSVAQSHSPGDPLLPVLRRIWLDRKTKHPATTNNHASKPAG